MTEQSEVPSFSAEYVWDLKAKLRAAEEAVARTTHETESKLAAQRQLADQRVLKAELRAQALRSGMVDLDALAMLDLAGVTLRDDGGLDGADAVFERMKVQKPYLFGVGSTSSTQSAPSPNPPKPRMAKDMSADEYQATLAKLLRA